MNTEVKITPGPDCNTMTLLSGKAPVQPDPKGYKFTGALSAPGEYYKGLHDSEPGKVLLQVNYGNFVPTPRIGLVTPRIALVRNYNTNLEDVVIGELYVHPDLERMQINTGARFSQKQIRQLIRTLRVCFEDSAEHHQLLHGIEKLDISSSSRLKSEQDNRGGKKLSFEKQVQTDLLQSFRFTTPLFVDSLKTTPFTIDLCFDHSEAGVAFWFESIELPMLLQNEARTLIDESISEYMPILPKLVEVG